MKANRAVGLAAALFSLAACSGGNNNGPSGDGGPPSCTLPAQISANMTLDTSCKPWIIPSAGTVVSGTASPVLTIKAGVTIAFQSGGNLVIGPDNPGAVMAVGDSSAHITFTSAAANPAPGDWSSVALADNALSTSTIAYADFDYGGGAGGGWAGTEPQAQLLAYNSAGTTLTPILHDITITHNAGNGIYLDGLNVGFGPGSGNLTVNDWGAGDAPFAIWTNAAGARSASFPGLPTSLTATASGGFVNLVAGAGGANGGAGEVQVSQTWPAIPLPYYVNGLNGGGVQIDTPPGESGVATLTVAAPNTLEFAEQGDVEVDPNGTAQGELVAVSSAGSLITFTSHSATPRPGDWCGIFFGAPSGGGQQLLGSQLQGVIVDYAGSGGCTSLTFDGAVGTLGIAGDTAGSAGPVLSGNTVKDYSATACGLLINNFIALPSNGYTDNTFIPTPPGTCTISQQ
ncbi:MAG: hypothetical protein ACYDCL_17785 [Myxococcales bacterium]